MTRPLLPHEPLLGGAYWAAWGDTGWSAVVLRRRGRVRAKVDRVNPKTQEATVVGRVRLDELVRRDPELEGKDKPSSSPAEVFAETRALRGPEEIPEELPERVSLAQLVAREKATHVRRTYTPLPESDPAARQAQVDLLLVEIDDGTTDRDW